MHGEAIEGVMTALSVLTRAVGALIKVALGGHPHHHPHLEGGDFMYIVKDDNPDVKYSLGPIVVTDAEGSPVTAPVLTIVVVSDNPSSVTVTPDADPKTGTISFGSPNPDGTPSLANLSATISGPDGTVLGVKGAQFTVTSGDPKAITGGDLTFAGLTETPPAPPAG